MINFDMVGRLRDKVLFIGGYNSNWLSQTIGGYDNKWLSQTLQEANHEVGLSLTPSPLNPRMGDSDHSSFLSAGITALHFFTGMHEDHHQPTDTFEKLNVEGIAKVVKLGVRFVYELGKDEK
jgi:Zn-dependent M28 family amino/carboxypeptidase